MKSKGPLVPVVNTPPAPLSPGDEPATYRPLDDSPAHFQSMLDFCFERTYLAAAGEFEPPPLREDDRLLAWRRVTRVPGHSTPGSGEAFPPCWQRILTTIHTLNRRFVYVLLREGGQTRLYLGTASMDGLVHPDSAVNQLEQAARGEMPGLSLEPLSGRSGDEIRAFREQIAWPLDALPRCGVITGLPSPRRSLLEVGRCSSVGADLLAGIDPVARGFTDVNNNPCNYALIVVADSVPDPEISDLIRRFRTIGGHVHEGVRLSEEIGRSQEENRRLGSEDRFWFHLFGSMVPSLGTAAAAAVLGPMAPLVAANLGAAAKIGAKVATSYFNGLPTRTEGRSLSITKERLNMVAEHCEVLIKRHIERLNRGRSLGFWNTGVYVLGESHSAVQTVCGMLRAAYSGDESHVEPIRAVTFKEGSRAREYVRNFRHVPMPGPSPQNSSIATTEEWHLLGPLYQYVSTPLNTEELSVTASLPRRDVPGIRAERDRVLFSYNGPIALDNPESFPLGNLREPGGIPYASYNFDLVGRASQGLIVGAHGSGKSTTCRALVDEATRRNVPFLIIEPTGDDHARWAVEHNIPLYMPGTDNFEGGSVEPLRLNLFQPAFAAGNRPDPLAHLDRVAALLTASMPRREMLPTLLEAAIFRLAEHHAFGPNLDQIPPDGRYPSLGKLSDHAKFLLDNEEVIPGQSGPHLGPLRANLHFALHSRINRLIRGRSGRVFDVTSSTDWNHLFERPRRDEPKPIRQRGGQGPGHGVAARPPF